MSMSADKSNGLPLFIKRLQQMELSAAGMMVASKTHGTEVECIVAELQDKIDDTKHRIQNMMRD